MARWLFKEEPSHYNYADLEREGQTVWNGVTNALALLHLRKVRPGDRVLMYHSGKEKAVVAEMEVLSGPAADPTADDKRLVVVTVRPVQRLQRPVPLSRIKADPTLADWELVRLPRLSVMPMTDQQWRRIIELSRDSG